MSNENTQLTTLTSLVKKDRRLSYKERNPKKTWAIYAKRDAKNRAAKKGVPFEITSAYILSILPDECPIFGTPFKYLGNGGILPTSPSLDRIDPSKGYVEGNVMVISSKANNIKSAYTSSDIFKVALWLQTIENKG
jgi:hypothetical protein